MQLLMHQHKPREGQRRPGVGATSVVAGRRNTNPSPPRLTVNTRTMSEKDNIQRLRLQKAHRSCKCAVNRGPSGS